MVNFFNSLLKFKNRTALINEGNKVTFEQINKNSNMLHRKIDENSLSLLIADNNIIAAAGVTPSILKA